MAKREGSIVIDTGCNARFSFETTGYCGGDAGHGGELAITIDGDLLEFSEPLQFNVESPGEDGRIHTDPQEQKITLRFLGDFEMECAAEGLEWLAQQIRAELPDKTGQK